MVKRRVPLRVRQFRRIITAIILGLLALAIIGLLVYAKASGISIAEFFAPVADLFDGLFQAPEHNQTADWKAVFSQLNVVQWILAVVFFGIFIYFIRGVATSYLRKASIIWGITALFYGAAAVLLFSKLDMMETGIFFILFFMAELLALVNCMALTDLGFFGSIFATYLQFVVLIPVGGILAGLAAYAKEQGKLDQYRSYSWFFQLVVLLVIFGYQLLVLLPEGDSSPEEGSLLGDMIGSEVDLTDWADM